jgi:hypothetical protein
MPQRMLKGPHQGGHRGDGATFRRDPNGAILGGTRSGGGVHGASLIMTILVMYTKACIRTCVKRRVRTPDRGPIASGRG